MHVCMHAPTAAQPHLKGVYMCTTCASVCAATISLIHPLCLSVCLYMFVRVFWCLYIQSWGPIHVQQASDVRSNSCHIPSYIHTLTHIEHLQSSTALCTQPRETHTLTQALKVRLKCRMARPTTGSRTNKATCIDESQRVRQPVVSHNQKKSKGKKTYLFTYTHVCTFVCMIVWGARANQRHTRHHRSSRVCEWSLSLHVRLRVSWHLSCMLIIVDKQKTDTGMNISEA
jgi:hypothetical protein